MLGHLSLGTVLVETGPRQFLYQCSQSRPTMLLGLDVNQLHQNKEVERFASSDIVLDWLGLFIYHCTWYSARVLYLSKNHFYCSEDIALYISLLFLLFLLCLLTHKSTNKDKTFHRKYLPNSITLLWVWLMRQNLQYYQNELCLFRVKTQWFLPFVYLLFHPSVVKQNKETGI